MKKKKTKQQTQAKPFGIDKWHFAPWDLRVLTDEQIVDIFHIIIHDDRFMSMFDSHIKMRNSIVLMQGNVYTSPTKLRDALLAFERHDTKIAIFILRNLVEYHQMSGGGNMMARMNELNEQNKDVEDKQEVLRKISQKMKMLAVCANIAETISLDLNSLFKEVVGEAHFEGMEGLSALLHQFRGIVDADIRNKPQEVQDMWIETFDAIEGPATKKIIAAFNKEAKLLKALGK